MNYPSLIATRQSKRAGLEWLWDIPAHWEMVRIKHGFQTIGSGTTPPSNQDIFYGGDIPWVNTSELRENVLTTTEKVVSDEALHEFSALKLYPKGSVLFAMYGATIGRVAILGISATVNQAVCVLANPERFSERYVFYGFQATRSILEAIATGGGQPNLNAEKVREHKLPCPPIEEQTDIADYLDRETARIDALVEEKECMLALLEEKRAALISSAVTRGLDCNAPLKPTTLDWLGDIPAHWEARTLKRSSSRIDTGTTPAASYMDGSLRSDFIWFTPSDFEHGGVITESNRKIPQEAVDEGEAKVFPAHSLMVIGIGATLGKVASSRVDFSTNQQINVIAPLNSVRWDYLLYVLQGYERVFRAHANSATLPILNQERLGAIRIPVPPPNEQDEIVNKLNESRAAYAEIDRSLSDSISLLKERRAALITAAVTGQIAPEEMNA